VEAHFASLAPSKQVGPGLRLELPMQWTRELFPAHGLHVFKCDLRGGFCHPFFIPEAVTVKVFAVEKIKVVSSLDAPLFF